MSKEVSDVDQNDITRTSLDNIGKERDTYKHRVERELWVNKELNDRLIRLESIISEKDTLITELNSKIVSLQREVKDEVDKVEDFQGGRARIRTWYKNST